MKNSVLLVLGLAFLSAPVISNPAVAAGFGADLHFHLFMNQGMTWWFSGNADEPLKAKSWKNRWRSNANFETLEKSGLKLAVIALYAHPLLVTSPRDSIRNQITQAEDFVAASGGRWVIARSSGEARAALTLGKRVIVLSLERMSWILKNSNDLHEFVDDRGVSIVTFLHLMDDGFGGVAFMPGLKGFATPFAFLESLITNGLGGGLRMNPNGLTDQGREMAKSLINRQVWVDLTHSSDLSARELMPMLEAAGQPILYTHTDLRKYFPAERGLADWQIDAVARTGGFVGLVPTADMLDEDAAHARPCGDGHATHLDALALSYNELAARIGAESIGIGTDFNSPVPHMRPSCGTGTSLDTEGFWNLAQSSELPQALRAAGANVPANPEASLDRFLDAWARVR